MNPSPIIEFVDYKPEFHPQFKALNKAWIEKLFILEDVDLEVINNPEKFILKNGGRILMVLYDGRVAGTCSLKNKGNGVFELTKMTVDELLRGQKIGWKLAIATLEKAKEIGAHKVELYSNRTGAAVAIQMYYKLGFKEVPIETKEYQRADIKMEIEIK